MSSLLIIKILIYKEDRQEEHWKEYYDGIKTDTEVNLDSVEQIDTDGEVWGVSKDVTASEVVMKWVEDNVELTEGEISISSGWREASIIATSSLGQDGVGFAARCGEAVGVALPESSSAVALWGHQ